MFSEGLRFGQQATIRIPASTANLGAAFDAAGLALQLYLQVKVMVLEEAPSRLAFDGTDAALVPKDESNLIWQTMQHVSRAAGKELPPFSLSVENQIPITRGLGSSASAHLAAVVAANALCDLQFTRERILETATSLEGHPDNVAPALYGGFVIAIQGDSGSERDGGTSTLVARSDFPEDWFVVAVTPDRELDTLKARAVLPGEIPYRDAVYNIQRSAFLAAQLTQHRKDGIREAMKDRLHQPYRSHLIPGLQEVLELERTDGLIGIALSGAGSTVVALADSHVREIGVRIQEIFHRHDVRSELRVLKADNRGLTLSVEKA